jgi:hypothetical protein
MPIKNVDARGLIDDELRVFYNRVPKAANTSVVFTLAKLRSGSTPTTVDIKKQFRRPSHLSDREVGMLENYLKFTFVRSPFSRVLSAYLHKICHRMQRSVLKGPETGRFTHVPTFTEFCRYLSEGGLYDNVHWAPQVALMLLPPSKFDFIGKVENFDNDLRWVLSRLGGKCTADMVVTHSNHFTHADHRLDSYYDLETRSLIGRLYADDFSTFGY